MRVRVWGVDKPRKMRYNIRPYFGGLGDSLQFSTFPEHLTELGHEVYLYTGKDVVPFRNSEIKKLWDCNPYIKGETTENWNMGDIPGVPYINATNSFIGNWEHAFGLPRKHDLPKIYYQPKCDAIGDLKHCKYGGIIELSAIYHKYDSKKLIESIRHLIAIRDDMEWLQLTSIYQENPIQLQELPQLEIKSIFELCDVIADCRIFASTLSGQHSLGAAVQRINPYFKQYCFIPTNDYKMVMDSKKFVFPNIEYLKT